MKLIEIAPTSVGIWATCWTFGEVAEVETWNADDNRWMLAVNRALGYATQDEWAEWQLRV